MSPFVLLSLDLPSSFNASRCAKAAGEFAGVRSSQVRHTCKDLFLVPAQFTKNLIHRSCKLHEYTSSLCRHVPTLDPVFLPLWIQVFRSTSERPPPTCLGGSGTFPEE